LYSSFVFPIGSLTITSIHEWIQALFPDIPSRIDENAVDQRYFFRNSFTGAVAICEFRKNEIIVESESASTIAIAKETITRLANYRRVTLDEFVNANDSSVISFLGLVSSPRHLILFPSCFLLSVCPIRFAKNWNINYP
jgi:hypothetical protein